MGKYHKTVSSIIIGLSLTGSVYTQNAKIDKISLPIKKDLIDNVKNNKDVTTDKETETIISFMSNVNNDGMKVLFEEYRYKTSPLDSLKQEEKDTALYETIREMNQRYGNPEITPKRSSTFNGKNYRGQFSPSLTKNKIHINPRIYNNKPEMVVIRLAELSHAKQYQQKGMIERIIKDGVTRIKDDFKYKKLYNQKGTIEYEAHKIIEPELYLEFVESYLSKIDTTDAKDIARAGNRIDYLINNMKSDSMDKKTIQDMSRIKEDFCKKPDMKQADTFATIIKETQKYIEEIKTLQAAKNNDAKPEESGE